MAEITVAGIAIKEGTNSKGKKWKNYVITDENGQKASGFQHAIHELANVKVGDVLDAVITDDGKFRNFESIKIIGHAEAPKSPGPVQAEQTRQAPYAKNDQAIAEQVAVKSVTELWIAGKVTDNDTEVLALRKWLTAHLPDAPVAVKSGQGTAQAPKAVAEVKGSDSPFPVDDMLQRICERLKFGSHATARNWVVKTCKIASEQIDADPESTWTAIKELQGWE